MLKSNGNLMIFILSIGVFSIINTEMGVIGILPLLAERFGVSIPQAGLLISLFALAVAFSGPVMPLLFSGMERKKSDAAGTGAVCTWQYSGHVYG